MISAVTREFLGSILLTYNDDVCLTVQYSAVLYDELCHYGLANVLGANWKEFVDMDSKACVEAVAHVLVQYTNEKKPRSTLLQHLSKRPWVDQTLQSAKA